MSIKQFFDTNKERAYWFSALARLCDAISVTVIVTGNPIYSLITILLGTIGREVSGFFKLEDDEKKNPQ